VAKLLDVLHELTDQGNTVVVIEHNLEVIKTADWVLDLGPEGGDGGGEIVAAGPPEDIVRVKRSYTGAFSPRCWRGASAGASAGWRPRSEPGRAPLLLAGNRWHDGAIMNARTQITLDPETQRRAQAKAAELGISFSNTFAASSPAISASRARNPTYLCCST